MERQLRLLLAGMQDSLRLHSSHLVTSPSTTNGSRREPITPPPVEGLQEKPLALIVNASLSGSNFRGLLLRNVNAIYCSMCRKMAFLNICFHLKFPKPFFLHAAFSNDATLYLLGGRMGGGNLQPKQSEPKNFINEDLQLLLGLGNCLQKLVTGFIL